MNEQEYLLEKIVGLRWVPQDAVGEPTNQTSVAAKQGRKGIIVAVADADKKGFVGTRGWANSGRGRRTERLVIVVGGGEPRQSDCD